MFSNKSEQAKMNFIVNTPAYQELAEKHPSIQSFSNILLSDESSDDKGEIEKYYTFNQTGNIMISSTTPNEKDIDPDVKKVFQKVVVFFAAWTAALSRAGKNLYDYDAIESIIKKSGFFVNMHEEDRTFDYSSKELTLNTAIINSVLGAKDGMGAALKIAQSVVESMGDQLRVSSEHSQSDKKVAHLLFVCENLLGMPIVSVSLIYTTAAQSQSVTKSNCHKTVSQEVNMTYHQADFMFVDPDYINKFDKEFESNPDFEKLIDKLAQYAKEDKGEPVTA